MITFPAIYRLFDRRTVKHVLAKLTVPAIISLILLVPLVALELTFNSVTFQNALGLFILFGFLWVLPLIFIFLITPLLRGIATGSRPRFFDLVFRIAFLALVFMIWGTLVIDQLPCFLGAPNCD